MTEPKKPGIISSMPPLGVVTGDELLEVSARQPDGHWKTFSIFINKIRTNQGLSAYEVAVVNGFQGTQEEWLDTLKGKSAFQLAIDLGFTGTEEEWLDSLNGLSAYAEAVKNGFIGSEAEWLKSLEGKSIYQIAVDNGFVGTEAEWLAQANSFVLAAQASADDAQNFSISANDSAEAALASRDAAAGFASAAADTVNATKGYMEQAEAARDSAETFAGNASDTAVVIQGYVTDTVAAKDATIAAADEATSAVGAIQGYADTAIAAKDAAEAVVPVVTAIKDEAVAASASAVEAKDATALLVSTAQQAVVTAGASKEAAEAAALRAETARDETEAFTGEVQNLVTIVEAAKDAAEQSSLTAQTAADEAGVSKDATDLAVTATEASAQESVTARDSSEAFAIDSLTTLTTIQGLTLDAQQAAVQSEGFAIQAQQAVVAAGTVVSEGIAGLANPEGSDEIGFRRLALAETITSVNLMLSGITVNIWEYADRITNKPTVSPSTWDWTPARNAATAAVKAAGGGWVKYPAGSYPHTVFTKLHSVSDLGDGSSCTYITALPRTSTEPYGMVEIDRGAVSSSHIVGIHFQGSETAGFAKPTVNAEQWGLYAKAQWDTNYFHGGWWYSECRDVRFSNFNKGGWTRGGYTNANYKRPIQFLTFDKVFFQVPTGGEALRMTGQHGQIEFRGGAAEGRDGATAWRGITLDWDPDPSTMADEASNQGESIGHVPGQGTAVLAPINVSFGSQFSIQKSQYGAYARNVRAIFFHECWCEGIGKLFTLAANARVHVSKNHLPNAADGSRFLPEVTEGYLYSLSGNAYLSFTGDNETQGRIDNYLDPAVDFNAIIGLNAKGMPSGNTLGKFKAYSNYTLLVDGTTLDIKSHKYVVVNPGADPTVRLNTITGTAAPGETIVIRPLNGTLTIANTGNISLNGLGGITVPQFGAITLLRVFQIGASPAEWVMVSCTEHYSTTVPANGFYYSLGTKIWNPGITSGSPMGWICTTPGLAGTTATFRAMPNIAAS
jgi:hypothetical protein